MKTINIIVLNFNSGEIDIYNCTSIRDLKENEDEFDVVQELLSDIYNLDEIEYMYSDWTSCETEYKPNYKEI